MLKVKIKPHGYARIKVMDVRVEWKIEIENIYNFSQFALAKFKLV